MLSQNKLCPIDFFGSEVSRFLKKYNNVPCLHMYRFIIKATRPAIFLRFAHMYVEVPNMYNFGLTYVSFAHNQSLKTLPQAIF